MKTSKKLSFDELVNREARNIALTILEQQLNKLNLPLPKDPDRHIEQILKNNNNIAAMAKTRVLAQQDAHTESLRAIGIEVEPAEEPAEIDFNFDSEEGTLPL